MGSHGAEDPGNRGAGDRLRQIPTAVGVDHDVATYPGAGHGFMDDHDVADSPAPLAVLTRRTGNPYREGPTRDARARIVAFFDRHLRAG